MAWANASWAISRAPVAKAVKALDGFAVAAWVLLAAMLLAVTIGSSLGIFDVGKLTPRSPSVHPVPAQASHWQPPPSPHR